MLPGAQNGAQVLFRLCGQALAAQPVLFAAFIGLTTCAALTEGFGVSLLIPLLQQAAPGTAGKLPWLDGLLNPLLPAEAGMRTAALAGLLAIVILARGILQVVSSYIAIVLPLSLQKQLSAASYDVLLAAGLEFFARSDGGILRTLVQEYPQRTASALKAMTDIAANVILATIYVALMLAVSWRMTLVALTLVGLLGLSIKRILTVPLGRTGEALSVFQERLNTLIYETGLGLKLIRLRGAEDMMRRSYQATLTEYFRYDARRQLIGEAQSPLMTTAGGLFVCGIFIYGSMFDAGVSTAALMVLVLCLYRLTVPVSRVLTNLVFISTNLDALLRREGFEKSAGMAKVSDGSRPFEKLATGVNFANVRFRYPESDSDALESFNLKIDRGEMVALVGPSGAGKTSVVNLLGRLYDPQSGSITIDEVDLREYQVRSWRRKIAVVSQDMTLFNMSVAENLTFGLVGVTRDLLEQAAAKAAALEFITQLPQGWDTRLGDRGTRLSGGQQQRLSIARAMLSDPELLILDEATSQLDTLTEQTIQAMIETHRHQRTLLVIAHRLSTIRRADRIAVMRAGRVVELGSHEDLSAQGSYYRLMLDAQQLDVIADIA